MYKSSAAYTGLMLEANSVDPEKTAPMEAVWSGSI